MTHPDILRTEKLGSRPFYAETVNVCSECGDGLYTDSEPCRDWIGNLFCCERCFKKHYGYKEVQLDGKGNVRIQTADGKH